MEKMQDLYSNSCFECSKLITNRYSTSFSMGIKLFSKELRMPIYAIYGFVRFADEIVDTFHGHDKASLLAKFRQDTYDALEHKISLNPILHTFQQVVHRYSIGIDLIDAFLDSMAMDLDDYTYTTAVYKKYIYGSAEVVGLMCLRIFCDGNEEQYQSLKEPACSLGSAFQKVNFLRDIKSDFEDDAYEGIVKLPKGARMGVYLAYIYYTNLLKKIKHEPAAKLSDQRIRVSDGRKFMLLCNSAIRHRLNIL